MPTIFYRRSALAGLLLMLSNAQPHAQSAFFPVQASAARDRISSAATFRRCQGDDEREICLFGYGKANIELASIRPSGKVFEASVLCGIDPAIVQDCLAATIIVSGALESGLTVEQVSFAVYIAYEEPEIRYDHVRFVKDQTSLQLRYPIAFADGAKWQDYGFVFERQ